MASIPGPSGSNIAARPTVGRRHPRRSKIRPITRKDDEAAIDAVRLVRAEFGVVGEGFNWQEGEDTRLSVIYGAVGSAYFVVEMDGMVCGGGGIAALPENPGVCELQRIYITVHARRRGLGLQLLNRCLYTARRMSYRQCYIETHAMLVRANHIFQRAGFKPIAGPIRPSPFSACDAYFLMDL
jgi:putative acetyltransferase